jgi:hypothetical protein
MFVFTLNYGLIIEYQCFSPYKYNQVSQYKYKYKLTKNKSFIKIINLEYIP